MTVFLIIHIQRWEKYALFNIKKDIFWTEYAFLLWEYATYLSKYALIF